METQLDINRLSLMESVLKDTFDLIRHADHKAQSLLRINLAIFAAAFIGVPPTVMALRDFVADGGWKFVLFLAVVVLYTVCAVCLLTSILKIVNVIRPRGGGGAQNESKFLFRSIAGSSFDRFRDAMMQITPDSVMDERAKQVFQSAVIAQRKYEQLDRAITWMLGGGLVGVLFALILLVSSGLI